MHRLLVYAGAGALIAVAGLGSITTALAHENLSRAVDSTIPSGNKAYGFLIHTVPRTRGLKVKKA